MKLQINPQYTAIAKNDPNVDDIDRVYTDDEFIVERYLLPESRTFEFRLAVHRRDKQPIGDWRTLQDAKNQAVGPERQAIQIFPLESQVTDTMNHYHLWVYRPEHGPSVAIESHESHLARQRAREAEDAARVKYLAMIGVSDPDD